MYNKKDNKLKDSNYKQVESEIYNDIRGHVGINEYLAYKVAISALALILKQTNNKESTMDYFSDKLKDETTLRFLKKVDKEYDDYILELSQKNDIDTLKASVLLSEPNRFTEVDSNSTPEGISKLAIEILDIKKEDILLDLGSGLNSFLIEAAKSVKVKESYGVEINTMSVIIANIRSFISEVSIEVIQGNIISQDFNRLKANKVFSNHPLGMRLNSIQKDIDQNLKIANIFNQSKRTISGDWVYNMAAYLNMKQPGRTVVIMTNSGTWNKSDEDLRKSLIEKGIVEGIILLPERLLSTTGIPLTMMILSQDNDNIKMVDASEIFTEGRRQNTLESNDIAEILKAYNNTTDISKIVSASEISQQEYILNPQRYIELEGGVEDGIDLGDLTLSINRGSMIKSSELDELSTPDKTDYHYLMLQNIQDGVIDSRLPNLIEIEDKLKKYCVKNNNLIISKLSPFKVARAHVKDEEEILANGNLYFIELDETKINPVFVEVFLQSEIGMAQLNRYAKGAAMKSISIQDLKMIQIPNLTRQIQDQIAEEYENLSEELLIIQRQTELIQDKKSKLLEGVL